jgi:alkylation response protein AidB-like acyl-CoA dehydrogenase
MDFKFTKEQEQLRKEFDQFFREEMKHAPPEWAEGGLEAMYHSDAGFAFHQHMKKKLAEKGWLSRAWPKEYGGQDAPLIEQLIFNEVHAHHRAPGVDNFGIGMFAPTIMVGGTEEQKKRLLPPIARGEVQYCQGWSEPDAGSDLANLRTTAVKEGDYYVVNGQKTWTTGAHRADHMFLLARTDPNSTRSRGLSIFNVKMDLPGIEIRPILYMDKGHITNDVYFKDVKIAASELVGKENEGWGLTRETMNFERSGVSGFVSGKRTIQELIDYAKSTRRDGKLLSENSIVREKIAKLFIGHDVGQTMAYRINWEQQKGGLVFAASLASESKVFGSELSQKLANVTTEIMGLYGQVARSKWSPLEGNAPMHYQFCVAGNIFAGSSEVQRNLIAWVGLGLPRFK